ncbi:MAG: DNA repair protein RecO [Deltaproteobacteria bacterium]|nr:DNA repair protein RecO [Deltaproteobacteria bacterium]
MTTDGLLLRSTPFGEADAVVQLFTREHGRVSALARGARSSKRRFAGALGLLVLSDFELKHRPRADLWSLESALIRRDWTALAGDVVAVAHLSYALEVVRELSPIGIAEPRLLDLLVELHEVMAERGPSPPVLRALELAVLETLGHAPVLDACAACGGELGAGVLFDPGRGGALCAGCAAQSRGIGVRGFAEGARQLLRAARSVERLVDAIAATAAFDDSDRAAARDAMVGMIVAQVGRPLRSVEFIAKLGHRRG